MNALSTFSHTKAYLVYVILEHRGTRPVRALDRAVTRRRPRITLSLNEPGLFHFYRVLSASAKKKGSRTAERSVRFIVRKATSSITRQGAPRAVASSSNDNVRDVSF